MAMKATPTCTLCQLQFSAYRLIENYKNTENTMIVDAEWIRDDNIYEFTIVCPYPTIKFDGTEVLLHVVDPDVNRLGIPAAMVGDSRDFSAPIEHQFMYYGRVRSNLNSVTNAHVSGPCEFNPVTGVTTVTIDGFDPEALEVFGQPATIPMPVVRVVDPF